MVRRLQFGTIPFDVYVYIRFDEEISESVISVGLTVNGNTENFEDYLSGFEISSLIGSYELCSYYDYETNVGFSIVGGGLVKTSSTTFVTDTYQMTADDMLKFIVLDFSAYYSGGVAGGGSVVIELTNPVINTVTGPDDSIEELFDEENDNIEQITLFNVISDETLIETFDIPEDPLCFRGDTSISTPYGNAEIRTLQIGDHIINGRNEVVKITEVRKYTSNKQILYCVPENSIKQNIPNFDLYITGTHAIKIDGIYHHVECLHRKKKYNIVKLRDKIYITYFHISTGDWISDTIVANNLECESLCTDVSLKWNCRNNSCTYVVKKNKINKIMLYVNHLTKKIWK